jgi:hypothetical protein
MINQPNILQTGQSRVEQQNIQSRVAKAKAQAQDVKAKAQAAKAKLDQAKAQAQAAKAKLKDAQAKLKNAKEKIKQTQDKINKLAQEQKAKFDKLKDTAKNAKQLFDQISANPNSVKATLVNLFLPILIKFINTEKTANRIIEKLIRATKQKLKDKGRVEVSGTTITFYPKDQATYNQYKASFDKRVQSLKKTVAALKKFIDTLVTVLRIARTILTVLQIQLMLREKQMLVLAASSAPDLAGPNWSKPVAAQYPINKEVNDQFMDTLKDKINNYILMITVIQTFLQIFQKIINNIKIKLDMLRFDIVPNPFTPTQDELVIEDLEEDLDLTEYTDGNGRNYSIEVITTPSGAIQAIAYDSFSRMKITQTAPSKFRTADELINELKLILG